MENANGLKGKRKARGNQLAIIMPSPSKHRPGTPAQNNSNVINESVQGVTESSKAGSRYSLRSQLKRPNNSAGLHQSREPLTKKPAKCSKQSSTAKLMQESEKPLKLRDERIPSEIALNVDLVVESLFRYINCTTLKSCRLVCRRWKYFGAKELQRRRDVTIQLSFGYVIDKSKKSARSLLTVMQNAEANTFPCAGFDISTEELSSPRIQTFLSVADARSPIKKLSLTLNYEKRKLPWKESTLLQDLRDLLFRQLSNLKDVEISIFLPPHWADELNTLDSGFLHLENSQYLLPRLTSLDLFGSPIPRKVFEDVMDAAVNLKSYAGCHFSPELLGYFVDGNGRHRIHLLKHLHFLLCGSFVDVMERLVSQHGDNIKLETFYFVSLARPNDGAEFWPRASSVISQLFISSASTMSRIGITPMRFLSGLAIPRLPNLSSISLMGFIEENDIANNFFFPSGFSLSKNFPNLFTVRFLLSSTLNSLEMLSITEPVTSVRLVWITDKDEIEDDTRALLYAAFPFVVLIKEEM